MTSQSHRRSAGNGHVNGQVNGLPDPEYLPRRTIDERITAFERRESRPQDERCGRRGATQTNTPSRALQPWV